MSNAETFKKRSKAAELIPRSMRQLSRDVSDAIANRNSEVLACFELRTADGQRTEAADFSSIDEVKEKKKNGEEPEWYVNVPRYRELLLRRGTKLGRSSSQTEAENQQSGWQEKPKEIPLTVSDVGSPLVLKIIEGKEETISELKKSNDFLSGIVEKLTNQETLEALVEISRDENIDPDKVGKIFRAMSGTRSQNQDRGSEGEDSDTQTEVEESSKSAEETSQIINVKAQPITEDNQAASESNSSTKPNRVQTSNPKQKRKRSQTEPSKKKQSTHKRTSSRSRKATHQRKPTTKKTVAKKRSRKTAPKKKGFLQTLFGRR